MSDYNKIWHKKNNNGEGFSVGNDDDDINELGELGKLIERSTSSETVAVYRDGDTITIVGDANGPWAVTA